MIRLRNAYRSFIGEEIETVAINNMDLHIAKGEFVSILGPSGCGKSSLLNILGMLDTLNDGEYTVMGESVGNASEASRAKLRNKHVGFIFQSFNLIDELTVAQNVELPLYYQNVPAAKRKQLVEEALNTVDIAHRKNHLPAKLSGGQQQRVAIARAIVTKPTILLADEPTGNLDSKNSTQVMQLLQELNRAGATIIMVTHDAEHVYFGSRVVELLDGKVLIDKTFGTETVNEVVNA